MRVIANGLMAFPLIYFAVISLLAVFLTVRDKKAAQRNARRVKERTLLAVAVLGGSAAMLLTMLIIRHKTRHTRFMLGIPLIIILQSIILMTVFKHSFP